MISTYLDNLQKELITGNALEHSYRPALKSLFEQLNQNITAVNEPVRSAHGSPDFVFLKKSNQNVILGYTETKDISTNLDDVEKTDQLKRYLGYSNLILTNYREFRFFKNGIKNQTIVIADLAGTFLRPNETNFLILQKELQAFLEGKPERIKNGKRLAEIMGGKARRIRENVYRYLQVKDERNKELEKIYEVMRDLLVHDLSIEKFADMYAQTLVYGLFVARYYDDTPENFSRKEAPYLIPASNPFLQHFFNHIAGPHFDKRLGYIVDELCEVFAVANIQEIIQKHFNLFGELTDKDPIIHFYEDFLKEYDPELRKSMGAYYTPVPVVQFMIRAVDEVLKNEFGLKGGIANTDKIQKEVFTQGKKGKEFVHKVQILDPAVGTATFLNEIIKHIHNDFKGQEGVWQSYVENELLPRLYGFELMMAPYTIAHLKLAMTLKDTGITHFNRRLGVYLTNTLEEGIQHKDDLFSNLGLIDAISEESKAAGTIKHERPIMVIIGNPPYSGESNNKGLFEKEIEVYKQEPMGGRLKERNSKWINDDYMKFIRFAESMIEKNGEGIVTMITNHGYIDNPTFRGMRWHLVNSFDSLYILDLHGNSKKKETTPSGGKDENVFNIQQGVAIIIGVKQKTRRNKLAEVYKANIWGKRKIKFETLNELSINSIQWEKINLSEPFYLFLNRNPAIQKEYEKGIKINELFFNYGVGITTAHDNLVIADDKYELLDNARLFQDFKGSNTELCKKLRIREKPGWNITKARETLAKDPDLDRYINPIAYRIFDIKFVFYHDSLVWRLVRKVMKHFILGDNIGLVSARGTKNSLPDHFFITKNITETKLGESSTQSYTFPLYLYLENKEVGFDKILRHSNLNQDLVKQLLSNIGEYHWVDDHESEEIRQFVQNTSANRQSYVTSLDILDYIYAILHSPAYRETYKEFLKIDFPRVPPAKDKKQFWRLVGLGGRLRQLHLLEEANLSSFSTTFNIPGENKVEKIIFENGKVWINNAQYFGNVPKESWEFWIGGYQPVQKWLKSRTGRQLSFEDVIHYQKIIKAQEMTIKIMKEIDIA